MNGLTLAIDGKDWARRIIARHEYGVKVNAYPLQCAREVLGLAKPEPIRPAVRSSQSPTRPHEVVA